MEPPHPEIVVGVAGWSYDDWVGTVYPRPTPRGFDRLRWMAGWFDRLEVNVTFYRVPAVRLAAGWVDRVEPFPRFRFSVKLPRELTHADPPDFALAGSLHRFLSPLREAGRLDGLLAQFPWSLRPGPSALDRIRRCVESFPDDDVAVEVRHGDWARDDGLDRIRAAGASLVSIDQPRVSGGIGPLEGPGVSTVRLHGRNERDWFRAGAGRNARYDHLYAPEVLAEWTTRIRGLLGPRVRVITNNHFRGQAVANALELRARLGQPVTSVPAPLVRSIPSLLPRLADLGVHPRPEPDGPDQGDLFAG